MGSTRFELKNTSFRQFVELKSALYEKGLQIAWLTVDIFDCKSSAKETVEDICKEMNIIFSEEDRSCILG